MQGWMKRISAIGFVLAIATGNVFAAPVVEWDYTVSSKFITADTTFNGQGPTMSDGCELNSDLSITWGRCPNGPAGGNPIFRSGIGLSNTPQSGMLPTNGAKQGLNTFTHSNFNISSTYATLKSTKIELTLGLRVKGSTDPYTTTTATYNIRFLETTNVEPCVVPGTVACSDIWVLDGSLDNKFDFEGNEYVFSVATVPSLTTLPDAVCAAAEAPNGCIGFTTTENQVSSVDFVLGLTGPPPLPPVPPTPVPTLSEWGVLLLSSLMLAGLRYLPLRRSQTRRVM